MPQPPQPWRWRCLWFFGTRRGARSSASFASSTPSPSPRLASPRQVSEDRDEAEEQRQTLNGGKEWLQVTPLHPLSDSIG